MQALLLARIAPFKCRIATLERRFSPAWSTLPGETREVLRGIVLLGAFFFVLCTVAYIGTIDWNHAIPRDGTTLVVGRDFLNFWMYGRAAFDSDPGRFYDIQTYHRALAELLGSGYPGQHWSYPPSNMLLAAPFGVFGYLPALALWTMFGLAIFVTVVGRQMADRRLLVPLLLSPAAFLCLVSGQSSFITAAMVVAIFACLDSRPLLAGVLIGMLTLKPQLGILFPVLLIASQRWRVFGAAAVTAVAVAAVAALLYGTQVWFDFIWKGIPTQGLVLRDPEMLGAPFMPTVFMNARVAGASYETALAIQAVVALLAIAAVGFAYRYRRQHDPLVLNALFLSCSIAALPYVLSYDTLPLCAAALMLLAARELDAGGRRLVQLVYWLPLIQIVLGTLHLPGPALIAPAFAVYLFLRLKPFAAARAQAA